MNELEDIWSQMLAESAAGARALGRHAVADYLALKATNDQIRRRGVGWLTDSLVELAAHAGRRTAAIEMEREDPHAFPFRGANLVGTLLRLRLGVRSLTLEAGWTRTPADGFMRGGALAVARLTHFGMKEANAELLLIRTDDLPRWFTLRGDDFAREIDSGELRRHFEIFTGG